MRRAFHTAALVFACSIAGAATLALSAGSGRAQTYDLRPLAEVHEAFGRAEARAAQGGEGRARALSALWAAVGRVESAGDAAALWLRAGDLAIELGRTDKAVEAFERASAHPSVAGPAQLRLAGVHQRGKRRAAAIEALDAVPPGCPDYVAARLQAATLLLAANKPAEALAAAREAEMDGASEEETVAARLRVADALWALGREDEAARVWAHLWWQNGKGAADGRAGLKARRRAPDAVDELLHELVHLPRTLSSNQEKALRKRVKRLARGARGLVPLADALLARPRRKEKDSAAEAALAALAATRPGDRLRPWALWTAAETVRKLDRDLEAVRYYRELASAHPSHPFAASARYEAGFLLTSQGLIAEARQELRALLEAHPHAEDAANATWELGWGAYLSGDGAAAERYFLQLLRRHGAQRARSRGFMAEQALYWLGRSREAREESERAVEAYRQLVDRYPLTYYATLAQGRLMGLGRDGRLRHRSDEDACSESMAFPLRVGIEVSPDLDTAVALHRLGYAEEAWSQLRHRLEAGRLPQQGLLLLLGLCQLRQSSGCADWLLRAYGRVGPLPDVETAALWKDAYPVRYESLAAGVAEANGVQPQLVLAVIRHESAFNPKVKSYAGAYGLMQVLPAVGREVAKRVLEITPPRARALLDPETNVTLGTRYLREILNLYHDILPLALAAYNAGPYAVKRWIEAHGHLAPDEFVEVMPYKGARAYAKKVLTTYAVYRYLYCAGPPDGGPAFVLPPRLPRELGPFMVPDDTASVR